MCRSEGGESSIRRSQESLLSHQALWENFSLFQWNQLFQTALLNKEKRDEGWLGRGGGTFPAFPSGEQTNLLLRHVIRPGIEIGKCYCPNRFIQAAERRALELKTWFKIAARSSAAAAANVFFWRADFGASTGGGCWMVPDRREALDSNCSFAASSEVLKCSLEVLPCCSWSELMYSAGFLLWMLKSTMSIVMPLPCNTGNAAKKGTDWASLLWILLKMCSGISFTTQCDSIGNLWKFPIESWILWLLWLELKFLVAFFFGLRDLFESSIHVRKCHD